MSVQGLENLADRSFSADPVYLTDLERCRPADALSRDTGYGRWRVLPYQTDMLAGSMLAAGTETAAPEVAYPLERSGWHAISIGIFGGYEEPNRILLKLSGEEIFSILRAQRHETTPWYRQYHGEPIWELFWKVADLTDQHLHLRQHTWRVRLGDTPDAFESAEAMVAYVKLVPLSDAELRAHQQDLRRTDTRRLFTHNDAGIIGEGPTTPDQLRSYLDLYRDTDFSRIYWEAGSGDRLNYFSDIGMSPPYAREENLTRAHERASNFSWSAFRSQGIDPFDVVREHAHAIGMEFHAGYRVSGFHYPPPYDHFNQGPSFFRYHPELRGTGRNGQPSPRISYAFPQTRRFVLSLLREIAQHPVDGISLQFNRRLPVIEYEPPVVESFKAEYGEDPFALDARDARWLAHRASFMTDFLREVRAALDDAAAAQGRARPIGISAIVTSGEAENLYYGLDLRAWVEQGLIDTLIPYSSNPNFNSNDPAWTDVRDAEFFIALTKGTNTRLALNLMPRQMSAAEYRRRAAALYAAGADHLFFWDGGLERAQTTGASHVVRRLGHRDEVRAWVEAGEPDLEAPQTELLNLGGWDFSYVSPG